MILFIFRCVAAHRPLMGLAIALYLYSAYEMNARLRMVQAARAGPPPDLRFGFQEDELNAWYDALGESGRFQYLYQCAWDLFPFMESYTLLLGALLYQNAQQAGWNPAIAWIIPIGMMFDVVETSIAAYGCQAYPDVLVTINIVFSSMANQLKWLSIGTGLMLLSVLFLYNTFVASTQVATIMERSDGGAKMNGFVRGRGEGNQHLKMGKGAYAKIKTSEKKAVGKERERGFRGKGRPVNTGLMGNMDFTGKMGVWDSGFSGNRVLTGTRV